MNRLAFALSVLCLTQFTGWSQSASLNVGSPFAFECEGGAITVTPNVSGFPGPYSFELDFDGLAPNVVGTDADLQPAYTVQASTPGVYAFELIATDGVTMVEALPVSFEVGATVEGSLSLASLGAGFFEDNISGPTTTFLYCGGVSSVVMDFDVDLNGPANSGTAVTIDWGDGTFDNSVGSAVSHNYAPGSWQIAMTVTHPSASLGFPCQQTTVYNVFVGTAPSPTLTLGESELCLNNPMAEIVLGNNSSTELTWTVAFSDGSQPTTVGPTTDDDILFLHTFTTTSCDSGSNFVVSVNAQNGCGSTFLNGGPFKVSAPPVLDIASATGSVACPDEPVMLTNASTPPQLHTPFGCTESYTYRWELDPGLTLLSGDLGSDNGFVAQPEFWSSGNPEIEVTSSTPGVYQIDLIAFSNSACGVDSASFYLNVEAAPSCECEGLLPAISLDDVEVCPGELVPSLVLPAMDGVTWSWTNDNPTTGLGASGLDDIPAWIAQPNTSNTTNTSLITVIGQAPGCDAFEVGSYEAGVLPTPTITAIPTDITICSGLSPDVQLFLNTDDTLFWTSTWDPEIVGEVEAFGSEVLLDNNFFNTGLNPAEVVFEVTVVNALNTNICPFDNEIVTVTVLPGLTPEQFPDVTLCPGEIAAPVALPAIADVTWSWYNDNPTTGLPASGLGDIPAWEALPNTSDTANTGTVTVIGQLPGCSAAEVGSYQVSVLAEGCEVGCVSDINNNGICDDQEVPGCTYAFAQNYNPEATDDDGSCTVAECESTEQNECAVEGDFNGDGIVGSGDLLAFLTMFGSECELECQAGDPCFAYSLTVEAFPAANPQLGTTYRFYVNVENETDFVSAVFGNNLSALSVFAPNGVYNDPANTSWSAAGINPAFLSTFPDLAADTYATIGLEGPAYLSGIADATDPSIVSDINQPITPFFTENGTTTLLSNTEIGASWYLLPAGNGSPQGEPWRVLLMQVTTTGSISGQLNYQILLDGDLTNNILFAASFDGAGVFPSEELIFIEGCMDENACNYDPEANVEPLDACVDPDLNGNCN